MPPILNEYSQEYCSSLEAAYGDHMMSEGGAAAIDKMFSSIHLKNKKILDVGFGLGGVAFYLANKHDAQVTGIEVNPWMAEEAKRRTPSAIKGKVCFTHYLQPNTLPFADENFDLVYSKGVLTHVQDKSPLFKEIFRVLKPAGLLVIEDWLSPIQNTWAESIQKMAESEGLVLYAETEENYVNLLEQNHFQKIMKTDLNKEYAEYNQHIVNKLCRLKNQETDHSIQNEVMLDEKIHSYTVIKDAILKNALLIRRFFAMRDTVSR